MSETFDTAARRAIRMALAREAYERGTVQLGDTDLAGFGWLVASHRGLFAVAENRCKIAVHGWFFGIERVGDHVYLFENCGMRDRDQPLGRIVRYRIAGGRIGEPCVLVTGLHGNCHQLRMIDGLLCVVDTANQRILRFTPEGEPVDCKTPFAPAPPNDTTGAYRHINSLARIDGRLALMCHNGKAEPDKCSEIAWLSADWEVEQLVPLDGHFCHDIVADENGAIWYCASREGAIASLDGRRVQLTDRLMTRALAFGDDRIVVGVTTFGPRQLRDTLGGAIVFLDRAFNRIGEVKLRGAPTDLVAL